jgi:hypothetical protein
LIGKYDQRFDRLSERDRKFGERVGLDIGAGQRKSMIVSNPELVEIDDSKKISLLKIEIHIWGCSFACNFEFYVINILDIIKNKKNNNFSSLYRLYSFTPTFLFFLWGSFFKFNCSLSYSRKFLEKLKMTTV